MSKFRSKVEAVTVNLCGWLDQLDSIVTGLRAAIPDAEPYLRSRITRSSVTRAALLHFDTTIGDSGDFLGWARRVVAVAPSGRWPGRPGSNLHSSKGQE